jgi:hypothetical protein
MMVQQFDILLEKWKKKLARINTEIQLSKLSKMANRLDVRANEGADLALIAATDLPSAYSSLIMESPVNYTYLPKEDEGLRGEIYVADCSRGLLIAFHTGCSMSVSPIREDKVVGMGKVSWTFFNVYGVTRTIQTMAYYIPEGTMHLFSPQMYFQENKGGSSKITKEGIELMIPDGSKITFPYSNKSSTKWLLGD